MIQDKISETIMLFQGDALGVLSSFTDGSVDAVVTDPPYSSGGVTLSARQADPAGKYQRSGTKRRYPPMLGDAKDQRSWTLWCTLWLGQCLRVTRESGVLLVFTDWRQLPSLSDAVQGAGWKWLGIVQWNKRSARPQIGKFRQQCEYVLFACKGSFKPATRQCLPGLFEYPVIPQQKNHLTSKPLGLMRDLLGVTHEGCTVLDPFMGGGTTGHACAETGRSFVGVELSAEYYALAGERIRAAAVSG